MNETQLFLADTCSILYPAECCHQLIVDLNYKNTECIKTFVSKSLGYGIIAGSTLVKLPQVIKILSAKSGAGISIAGVFMEVLAATFSASYSFANKFPFSAWGETFFLMLVTAMVAFLVLYYDTSKSSAYSFLILYSLLTIGLMSGLTPVAFLWYLQAVNLPLVIFGKLLQASKNLKNGHTGQLSAITIFLLFAGAVVRIFTSIHETGDQLVVFTYLAASFANLLLVIQLIYYWNATNLFLEKTAKKKKL